MGYEWLAIAMFGGFFVLLISGYPVAFSFAGSALVFGLINALIKPVVSIVTCPINVLTLGLFTLIINALMLMLTDALSGERLTTDGFLPALLGGIAAGDDMQAGAPAVDCVCTGRGYAGKDSPGQARQARNRAQSNPAPGSRLRPVATCSCPAMCDTG